MQIVIMKIFYFPTFKLICVFAFLFTEVLAQENNASLSSGRVLFDGYKVNYSKSDINQCLFNADKKLKVIKGPDGSDVYALKNILPEHFIEWKESAVDDKIIKSNLISIPDVVCRKDDMGALEFLTPIVDFLGWKRVKFGYNPQINRSGWIVRGLAPPYFNEDRLWSQIKIVPSGRYGHKYETPIINPGQSLDRITLQQIFLKVSQEQADKIFNRINHQPKIKENFWLEILNSNAPIQLTEGVKKAASILSAGYAAIGMPGVCAGMHTTNENAEIIKPVLHQDIKLFMKKQRKIYLVYDMDDNPAAREIVWNVQAVFGDLLLQAGADIRIVQLPGPEKGPDDFILARGEEEYHKLVANASSFEDWKKAHNIRGSPDLIVKYRLCRT